MLATLAEAPLQSRLLVYEPKYDGIRILADITLRPRPVVRLWSRLGNEKTAQFPEIAGALEQWARRLRTSLVLDGEIVALDAKGHPAGFQSLQRRTANASAVISCDVLRDGATDLRGRPLVERRQALERIFARTGSPLLRLSEMVVGDGRALYARALANCWEGLIAKRAASVYLSGKRTPDWRKLKITHVQEFVVGGWTEPRPQRDRAAARRDLRNGANPIVFLFVDEGGIIEWRVGERREHRTCNGGRSHRSTSPWRSGH